MELRVLARQSPHRIGKSGRRHQALGPGERQSAANAGRRFIAGGFRCVTMVRAPSPLLASLRERCGEGPGLASRVRAKALLAKQPTCALRVLAETLRQQGLDLGGGVARAVDARQLTRNRPGVLAAGRRGENLLGAWSCAIPGITTEGSPWIRARVNVTWPQ